MTKRKKLETRWIAGVMKELGKRPRDLAAAIGIHSSEATKILSGKANVAYHRIPDLSRFLCMPVGEISARLLGDPGYQPPDGSEDALIKRDRDSYRAYCAALEILTEQGLADLSVQEIDDCATALVEAVRREGGLAEEDRRLHILAAVMRLKSLRPIRGR